MSHAHIERGANLGRNNNTRARKQLNRGKFKQINIKLDQNKRDSAQQYLKA